MRYWNPFPEEAVADLMGNGADQFLIVPAYPQYSAATNGSTLIFVLDALRRLAADAKVHALADWHLLPGYVEALAQPVIERLSHWANDGIDVDECVLLYVAHSLPESFIRKGDPYLDRTRETIKAVHDLVTRALEAAHPSWLAGVTGGTNPRLVFQSKVGPIRWLGPQIDEEVPRLAAAGCRRLMVQPVSFTCEHIETLLELDIELKEQALHEGIVEFQRGPALNLNETWLVSLANHLADVAFSAEAA
jgi:ferrochelatase